MKRFLLFPVLFLVLVSCQLDSKIPLSKKLDESSALAIYNGLFLTVNDSDNDPIVFVFNDQGQIIHQSYIENSINWDWEAIVIDGDYLYIGDFGNNLNDRQDLRVFKVKVEEVMEKDTSYAEEISFSYPDQQAFPPEDSTLYYDAEAMIVKDDSILIFSKNRTVPFDGISNVYKIPKQAGAYVANFSHTLQLPATNWLEESITDAYYFKDTLYLLTYSKIYQFEWKDDDWNKISEQNHTKLTQKEGIAVDEHHIYVVDERNKKSDTFKPDSHNYLYQVKKKD